MLGLFIEQKHDIYSGSNIGADNANSQRASASGSGSLQAISNSNPPCSIVRNVPTLTRIKIVKTSKEAKLSYLTVLRIGIVKPTAKHVDCEGQFEFSIIRIFAYRTPKILALLWLSPVEGHRSPLWLHPK